MKSSLVDGELTLEEREKEIQRYRSDQNMEILSQQRHFIDASINQVAVYGIRW